MTMSGEKDRHSASASSLLAAARTSSPRRDSARS
jgi:hypothetical protein